MGSHGADGKPADQIGGSMADVFNTLRKVDVNDHTEQREGLTYLSWAWAWAEVKKLYPGATYNIWKDELNRPYVYDQVLGYMVFTTVTIEGETNEMWLPVMDSKNKAMKAEPYEYQTKYGKKRVEPATMFDINKAIMRCLVKNLAMFGLGLYIYAGEDLPESDADPKQEAAKPEKKKPAARAKKSSLMEEVETSVQGTKDRDAVLEEATAKAKVLAYVGRHEMSNENIEKICRCYGVTKLTEMTMQMCQHYIAALEKKGGSIDD